MKKLSVLVLLVAFSSGLFASPVSLEYAKSVANNFYTHYSAKSNIAVSDVITYQKEGINTFYVFIYESGGFVIVSADDAAIPVLGYSTTDTFDKNNIPVNAKSWLESYNDQIKFIIEQKLSNSETSKEWSKLQNNMFEKSTQAVTPLCSTLWDQSSPYNQLCPTNTYTGCVATAMAQIMKKWDYPTTGVGTHSYTDPTYGTLTANFGATTYDWANMLDSYLSGSTATQKTAVATLMFHCGVSVNMTYGTSGSGAYSWDVPAALINYFNYSPTAEIKFLADFTSPNWITMLKGELDAGRPVYYSGTDGSAGHAFVCDGYNASNQFHFNWGWSGWSNNYYAIGSLNPSGNNFNLDNSAIVRITPPSSAPIADFVADNVTPLIGGSVNFTNNSTNNPTTYSWVFDGGTPSTSTLQTPPAITYNTGGYYQVSLTVTNGNGTDTKVRSSYINVGGTPLAWIKQNSGFVIASRGIEQIFIVNPYVVWATAYDGTAPTNYIREFTRTVNGGITWTPGTITFTNSTAYGVSNIFAFNDTICYACMFPITGTGGRIVKTIDAGLTWTEQTTAPFTNSWADFVHFFNVNDGVCMGDPTGSGADFVIYTTTNGGTNWVQVPLANIPNCSGTEAGITNFYDAVGNTVWFGTSLGRVYKSVDKGLNWTVANSGTGSNQTTVAFKDANTGIAILAASPYTMRRTTDGGTTWATVVPTGYYVKRPHIDFVPGTSSMWFDVSSGPSLGSSYSMNDCTTFLNIDTGSTQYTCVTAYDYNTAWAGGFNLGASDGGIYKWNSSILLSMPEPAKQIAEEVVIYPNPTNDFVNVEFPSVLKSKVIVNIYNVLGKKILSQEIQSGTNIAKLNLSGNNAGIYLLTIDDGSKVITKRISKIK